MNTPGWFHFSMSAEDAENLLFKYGYDGSFLVRPSKSNEEDFTLSVRHGAKVTHVEIQYNGVLFYLYRGKKFATLSELVQYYMDKQGELRETNGNIIRLKTPLQFADPTTERWFHRQLTGTDAERLLFQEGKYGSFLVRASKKQPGNFVLSARTRDMVTHVVIRRLDNKYDVGGGKQFNDLHSLIEHYKNDPMVKAGTGEVIHLHQPLLSKPK